MTGPRPLVAVVDDEPAIRKALSRLLRSVGMDVEVYPSGGDFLAALPLVQPDCVVLDLHMPVLDGFAVQQSLNELKDRPPVIIITGHDLPETRARAMAGQPVAYLRKPMNDDALLDAIALALATTARRRNP
ncbi:MAG: response regulator [Verrucomicrobiales bacterium]|nr:response regulator [Verrucomicrobiales bacterium]